MYTREEMLSYHCPRWNEWPNLDLYMDQVISLLEESVSKLYPSDAPKIVTSTMINNYVKQKIALPSKNKKYNREHMAYLYFIFLLKSVFNLPDISDAIKFLTQFESLEEGYNIFCDEIESAIHTAFNDQEINSPKSVEGIENIHTMSLAFAYTLLTRFYNHSFREKYEVIKNS